MSRKEREDELEESGDDAASKEQKGGEPEAALPSFPPSKPRAKKVREPDPEPPGAPEWVVTFTDMISLLVTFFVLLMTFSSMREYDLVKINGVLKLNKGLMDDLGGDRVLERPDEDLIHKTDPLEGGLDPHSRPPDFEGDRDDAAARAQRDHEQIFDLNDIADGLLIQWDERASFAAGSVTPNAYLRAALVDLAEKFAAYPHAIVVEGHAAPDHVATQQFPDADSIALERARVCARILVEEGKLPIARVQIAAYGAARAKVLNDTATGRNHNRRIELRVLSLPRDRAAYVDRGSGDKVR